MGIFYGTYIGDGSGVNRTIPYSPGFLPDLLMLTTAVSISGFGHSWSWKWRTWPDPNGAQKQNGTFQTSLIRSFTATSFEIGTANQINNLNDTYSYVALSTGPGIFFGSYTGDGTDPRDILGIPFAPLAVIVVNRNDAAAAPNWSIRRTSLLNTGQHAHRLGPGDVEAVSIRALLANGFRIGLNAFVNGTGLTYDYLALGSEACQVALYTGDGTANRTIALPGVGSVGYAMTGGADPVTAQTAFARTTAFAATFSSIVPFGQQPLAGRIVNFVPDGVVISNSGISPETVNVLNLTYEMIALRSQIGGPSKIGKRLH